MYTLRTRKKLLSIKEREGLSIRTAARRFGLSPNTIFSWLKRIEPKLTRNKQATKIDMEALSLDVKQYNDGYNYERADRLGVSTSCVRYALKRLGISYKKTLHHPKAD